MYGYSAGEIIGRNISVLMPGDYRGGAGGHHAARRRRRTRPALRDRPGDEGRRSARGVADDLASSQRGRARSSAPRPSPGTSRSRTATSRSSENSEARLRSVVESAVDGIIVIDAARDRRGVQPGAERLFGYGASEVIGRNVSMLMPSPYREEHDGYLAHYLRTGEARIIGIGREVTARRKDGTTFPVQSVGRRDVRGGRAEVHRHPSRPERARAGGGAAARAGRARAPRRDGGRDRARGEEPAGGGSRRDSGDRQAPARRQPRSVGRHATSSRASTR